MKVIQRLIARFATDQEFSDIFDAVMTSDGFDGTVFISQMLYNVNQTVTTWEANANYRDVLGLPPL